jgi:hypothetical protein
MIGDAAFVVMTHYVAGLSRAPRSTPGEIVFFAGQHQEAESVTNARSREAAKGNQRPKHRKKRHNRRPERNLAPQGSALRRRPTSKAG